MVSIAAKESDSEANRITDSEDEAHILAIDPMVVATRSERVFSNGYDQVVTDPSEVVPTPAEVAAGPLEPVGLTAPPPPTKPAKATDK